MQSRVTTASVNFDRTGSGKSFAPLNAAMRQAEIVKRFHASIAACRAKWLPEGRVAEGSALANAGQRAGDRQRESALDAGVSSSVVSTESVTTKTKESIALASAT
jgi:hypothetical protein